MGKIKQMNKITSQGPPSFRGMMGPLIWIVRRRTLFNHQDDPEPSIQGYRNYFLFSKQNTLEKGRIVRNGSKPLISLNKVPYYLLTFITFLKISVDIQHLFNIQISKYLMHNTRAGETLFNFVLKFSYAIQGIGVVHDRSKQKLDRSFGLDGGI